MPTSFRIESSDPENSPWLRLSGRCCLLPHATQLLSTVEQVLAQRLGVLWIDCQHIEEVGRIGQQAILQVERLAAAAQVLVYWCGFSKPVMEQMSESGLHLLLRNLPVVSYYDSGE